LRLPALFRDVPTFRAGTASIAWIDQDHKDPRPLGFVRHKIAQLPKTPIGVLIALASTNRRPASDVRQVFEHQHCLRVFGLRHKLFGNCMVHPSLEPRLESCQLLQPPFGTFRRRGLIGLAMERTALADNFDRFPGVALAIAIGRASSRVSVHSSSGLRCGAARPLPTLPPVDCATSAAVTPHPRCGLPLNRTAPCALPATAQIWANRCGRRWRNSSPMNSKRTGTG
jgi:hypothetical protein